MTTNAKLSTPDILKGYTFIVKNKRKLFCPNCFNSGNKARINKHFINCSFKLEGEKFLDKGRLTISKVYNNQTFKNFLKKFNKFLRFETEEIREIPYNKSYDYWIFQDNHPKFGSLLMGLAFVRFNQEIDHYVLPAIIIFPSKNRNIGGGSLFMKVISKQYEKLGDLVVESPNELSKKIAEQLGIEYYYHP